MMKKSFQGERDNDIDDIPVPARKKLNKTVIITSSNPEEDQSKYFVEGFTFWWYLIKPVSISYLLFYSFYEIYIFLKIQVIVKL